MHVETNETLDDLGYSGLKVYQARKGYRFSLDPFLLAGFARLASFSGTLVDLGCGNGVLPLLAAAWSQARSIIGIERQPAMVGRARRSVVLNGLEGRVRIEQGRVQEVSRFVPVQSVDLVLTNPPFRRPGSGRIAPGDERGAARHELDGSLEDFLRAAAFVLRNGGRLCLVHLSERLADVFCGMRAVNIEPKRVRLVHPRVGEPANLVLVEGRRASAPGLEVEPPLYVYERDGYSQQVEGCYRGGSL
ncbi:MAG: tRNA1(Val) (adenine(37)-N6)-methyltransferase [Geothermobacteraceae bacterium]